MTEKRKKPFLSNSVFRQMFTIFAVIGLAPFLVVSFFLVQRMNQMAGQEIEDYRSQLASQYVANLEENLVQYKNSVELIANNTVVISNLMDQETNPYVKGQAITDEVLKSLQLGVSDEIRNCMVYAAVENAKVYGRYVTTVQSATWELWQIQDLKEEDGWFSCSTVMDGQSIWCMLVYIDMVDEESFTQSRLGFVMLNVFSEKLFEPAVLKSQDDSGFELVVIGSEGQTLYSDEEELEYLVAEYQKGASAQGDWSIMETGLEDFGLEFYFLFNDRQISSQQQENRVLTALIALVLFLGATLSWQYSRKFSRKVNLLLEKFQGVEEGNLTPRRSIRGNDEFALLDQRFDHMLVRLNEQIQNNYAQQLENREAQLENLQLQINSHFLYNTLETISSLAAVHHVFDICDICQMLGDIFHYSPGRDYGETVLLEQELTYTRNYMGVQKIRYGSRIEVCYQIEVDPSRYEILCFILRPIVENALQHGLEKRNSDGILEIRAKAEKETLILQVADNGVGMSAQKVAELEEYIDQPGLFERDKRSIGVRNVNQRIHLTYGEAYGVRIESRENEGSLFTIVVPAILKEAKDEIQSADC